ncbi:hypothetical protein [Yinghuangia seranimata]|uniref:hypothetical protein n=1 Tax=Yinghuangia seranimata TaxID=408067 RepID=UPI00248BA987|nr:hypothetical protein [Yinghuangia seranimata]MDI2131069.1 hypothetical protein [Yinghuangia seranimata]
MPTPIPASDAQLRASAQRAAERWASDRPKEFELTWRAPATADRLLGGVPSEQRLELWRELLRTFVEERARELAAEAAKRRGPAGEQAYAALRDTTPRPTDQDLAQGPATDRMLADAVAATAAGRELAAITADFAKRIADLAGGALRLETVRVRKDSELTAASRRLAGRVARGDRIKALVDVYPDRVALLAAIDPAFWEAHRSGHALLSDAARAGADADRALRSGLGRALADQEAAVTTAFDAVTPTVTTVADELAVQLEAVAESVIVHYCTPKPPPPPPDPVPERFKEFVTVYREGQDAVLLAPRAAALIAGWASVDGRFGGGIPLETLTDTFRTDTPAQVLADALTLIAGRNAHSPEQYQTVAADLGSWARDRGVSRR